MMNSRHLPAGQGIPMDTGRRRAYNQNQYQNQQFPQPSIYPPYIQTYSTSYYSQSMQPPYQNSQPPIPYTPYQSYVRSPPVQQYVAPPLQPLQVPFPRSNNPPAAPPIHQAFSPHTQTPLSSRSSQSSTTIAASLVSSTSKKNSSENFQITRSDLIVTPPFKAPLPWFSRPDLSWPERRTPIKRRPLKNISGTLKLPINIRSCSLDKSQTQTTEDKIIISETNKSHKSEDTLTNPTTPVSVQPQCHTDIIQVTKTAPKINNRPTPVVPALPRPLHRYALSPSLDKDEEGKNLFHNDILHQACVTDIEKPQETAKIISQEQEPAAQASAWKTPKIWAGIFHPSAASSNLASREAVSQSTSQESQVKSVTSLAEVLESFSTKSNESKVTFLEPRGLVNTGNMCYMNSILQVLIFCTLFYDFLDQVSKRAVCSLKSITPLLDAMILFMREYSVINSGISADQLRTRLKEGELEQYGDPFIPDFFYNVINRLPRFSSMRQRGHQQDAEEFLGFLLEGLHDECVQAIRNTSNEESINAPSPSKEAPSLGRTDTAQLFSSVDCTGWLEVGPKQKASITRSSGPITIETPVTKIFGGNLRSELRVPGLKDSVTIEPFQSLLLDIGAPHVNNIVDALRGLTNPEPLHGVFKSPKGPNVKATKQVFIEKLPPVLILYLKRFQYDNTGGTQKIWKKIGYPLELELPIEVFSRQKRVAFSNTGLPKYRLISAVYHHGKNASGGHYTVDVRRQDGQEWIRLDDTVIKRIKSEDVAEGGSEEDPEVIASNIDQKKKTTSVFNTKLDSLQQSTEKDGWKQASGPGKKWPNTVNGNSPCKLPSDSFSLKDNKVAYLLFYQKI
ncbi:putative ubiquitin carboxyl-terminal hydrolase 3 [Golovinomyces cichoracearum]|uniref:ubiquitinyl hydrolase 1 n=1 Tax=Golovinomyces cichoracearum TaxID=62708 RepID=A0A420IF76_9PEZI|nr:putative ubiquitin carboxyl-terminal hydrolase 3 [Golovinomyces cichoracearum]